MSEEVELGMTVTIPGTYGNIKVVIRREKQEGESDLQHRVRVRKEVRAEVRLQMRNYNKLDGWTEDE